MLTLAMGCAKSERDEAEFALGGAVGGAARGPVGAQGEDASAGDEFPAAFVSIFAAAVSLLARRGFDRVVATGRFFHKAPVEEAISRLAFGQLDRLEREKATSRPLLNIFVTRLFFKGVQASRWDASPSGPKPGDESPGYSRKSLPVLATGRREDQLWGLR